MMTSRDEVLPALVRAVKLLAIGLAINTLPELIPFNFLMEGPIEVFNTITSIVHAIGFLFLIAAARVAASAGAPTHG
jgi:hypothetical protein